MLKKRRYLIFAAFFTSLLLLQEGVYLLNAGELPTSANGRKEMALIPAGEFIMGMKDDDPLGLVWATPQRKVFLPAYYIDKYEVTNREYKKFVDATGRKAPFDERYDTIYNWKYGKYHENLDDHPVALVDWYDADAYCRWAGKRLPAEEEWEKAARGTDGLLWPWGNKFDKFKANTVDFEVEMTMPVGSFPEGASPYGVMDMAGNVFEWTSSWYKAHPGSKHKHPDYGETYKVTRGGAWTSYADPYAYAMSRTAQPSDYKHRSIGFRCSMSEGSDGNE